MLCHSDPLLNYVQQIVGGTRNALSSIRALRLYLAFMIRKVVSLEPFGFSPYFGGACLNTLWRTKELSIGREKLSLLAQPHKGALLHRLYDLWEQKPLTTCMDLYEQGIKVLRKNPIQSTLGWDYLQLPSIFIPSIQEWHLLEYVRQWIPGEYPLDLKESSENVALLQVSSGWGGVVDYLVDDLKKRGGNGADYTVLYTGPSPFEAIQRLQTMGIKGTIVARPLLELSHLHHSIAQFAIQKDSQSKSFTSWINSLQQFLQAKSQLTPSLQGVFTECLQSPAPDIPLEQKEFLEVLWMGLSDSWHWEQRDGVSFYPATSVVTSQKRVLFVIDGEGERSEVAEPHLLTPPEGQSLLIEGDPEFLESIGSLSFRYRRTLGGALQSCENVSVILLGADVPQWLPKAALTPIARTARGQREKYPMMESALNRRQKGFLETDTVGVNQSAAKDVIPSAGNSVILSAEGTKDLLSVTDIGTFLKCPFLFYAKKILGLRPQESFDVDLSPVEKGELWHKIIYQFWTQLGSQRAVSEEEMVQLIDEEWKKFFLNVSKPGREDIPASWWDIERERWKPSLISFLMADWEATQKDLFKPVHWEWSFGGTVDGRGGQDPSSVKDPLTVILRAKPEGSPIENLSIMIRGRIDRIDINEKEKSFRVCDYKTGVPPSLKSVAEGRDLQLFLYLLAVSKLLLPGYRPHSGCFITVAPRNCREFFCEQDWWESCEKIFFNLISQMKRGEFFVDPTDCPNGCALPEICPFFD